MLTRLLMTALFFSFGSPAAAPAAQAATEHAPLFEAAAQEVDVPPELTQAIARVESGGTPYALNIEGRGYFFDSKEEALAAASEAQAAGQSFDSGIMQVNNWWMERFAIDPFSLLDPATNERWGKWILAEEISRHGLSWKAVGKYHSPDPERGRRYAWLVYRHYAGLGASRIQEAPCAEQKVDSQNLSDPRGTRTDQSIGPQGGAVPFHVQQKGVPWVFRPKSGASGGKD